jgi:hypothetical protein
MNRIWVYSPEKLLYRAVVLNLITVEEITEDVWNSAVDKAESINDDYLESGHGIGSSDTNYFVKDVLTDARINVDWVNNRLTRR